MERESQLVGIVLILLAQSGCLFEMCVGRGTVVVGVMDSPRYSVAQLLPSSGLFETIT